ncbi:hypothetical protein JTE90_008220 [Oedothorax gibbosus]|uniref:Regulatory protein zeste n=1 Tax=Oedothorax gibbosus TaxID=931172 RepID=A0AAV6TPQ7_9ARAC|nr:hypothetical protein JTE90_008220 [Oedothorax gibbosus]
MELENVIDLTNKKELDIILCHLECVPDLVSGAIGGYFKTPLELRKYWDSVALELAECGLGKPRSGDTIKKKRYDLKHRTKLKARKHTIHQNGTGGQKSLPPLTDLDERVIKLTGTTVVTGITTLDFDTTAVLLDSQRAPSSSTSFACASTSYAGASTSETGASTSYAGASTSNAGASTSRRTSISPIDPIISYPDLTDLIDDVNRNNDGAESESEMEIPTRCINLSASASKLLFKTSTPRVKKFRKKIRGPSTREIQIAQILEQKKISNDLKRRNNELLEQLIELKKAKYNL